MEALPPTRRRGVFTAAATLVYNARRPTVATRPAPSSFVVPVRLIPAARPVHAAPSDSSVPFWRSGGAPASSIPVAFKGARTLVHLDSSYYDLHESGTPPPLMPLWTGDDWNILNSTQDGIISEWPEPEGSNGQYDIKVDDGGDESGAGDGGDPSSSGASSLFGGSTWTDDGRSSASACDDDDNMRVSSESLPRLVRLPDGSGGGSSSSSGGNMDHVVGDGLMEHPLTGARWESRWPQNVFGADPAGLTRTMPVWPQSVSPTVWRVLSGHDLVSLEEYVSPVAFITPTSLFHEVSTVDGAFPAAALLAASAGAAVLLLNDPSLAKLSAARFVLDDPLTPPQVTPGLLADLHMASKVGAVRALRDVALFVCPIPSCPKSFGRRHDLKRHLRVHARHQHVIDPDPDETADALAVAGALTLNDGITSAYDVDSLLQADAAAGSGSGSHVTQSSGVTVAAVHRPMQAKASFTCIVPWCSHTFTTKAGLIRHAHTHTGERLHSCGICGQLFGRLDNCRKHELGHGGDDDNEMRADDSV